MCDWTFQSVQNNDGPIHTRPLKVLQWQSSHAENTFHVYIFDNLHKQNMTAADFKIKVGCCKGWCFHVGFVLFGVTSRYNVLSTYKYKQKYNLLCFMPKQTHVLLVGMITFHFDIDVCHDVMCVMTVIHVFVIHGKFVYNMD